MRRPLPAVVLLLVGAFLVLVATGRPWVLVSIGESALLPTADLEVSGSDLRPGLPALGLVGLAGLAALAATRGRGRTVVGALLALTGVAVLAIVVELAATDPGLVMSAILSEPVQQAGGREGIGGSGTLWPAVTGLGGGLLLMGGLVVARFGPRWSSLGRRYEAPTPAPPTAPAPSGERELWEALDRGEDPTGRQDPADGGPQARD